MNTLLLVANPAPLFRGEWQGCPKFRKDTKPQSAHKPRSVALIVKPRRFATCRQIATFPKAEFAAAHSRKGGICCGSQPQRRNLLRLTAAYVVPHIPSPAPLPPQCKTLSVSPDLCLPPHKALLRADGFQ